MFVPKTQLGTIACSITVLLVDHDCFSSPARLYPSRLTEPLLFTSIDLDTADHNHELNHD